MAQVHRHWKESAKDVSGQVGLRQVRPATKEKSIARKNRPKDWMFAADFGYPLGGCSGLERRFVEHSVARRDFWSQVSHASFGKGSPCELGTSAHFLRAAS